MEANGVKVKLKVALFFLGFVLFPVLFAVFRHSGEIARQHDALEKAVTQARMEESQKARELFIPASRELAGSLARTLEAEFKAWSTEADTLARSLPSARGPSQRLFAFGADAWKLCAWFDLLYNQPGASIAGATGRLSIDVSGPVKRMPAWAVFVGGRGRPAAAATQAPHGNPAAR